MEVESVTITSRLDSEYAIEVAEKTFKLLKKKGVRVILEENLAKRLGEKKGINIKEANSNIIIVVGGDGTVLRTANLIKEKEIPLLTINAGTVGFLSEINPTELEDKISTVLKGNYRIEECTRIKGTIQNKTSTEALKEITITKTYIKRDALNEIAIITGTPLKVINLTVKKDGNQLFSGGGDGVIISTTTGATAYALSAGGPIIDPQLDVFVVVYLAPLKINQRPMVIPSNSRIEVEINHDGSDGMIIADGQEHIKTPVGTKIILEKSENKTRFIRIKRNFYEKLHKRLIKDV